jgi:opacity protein-like surface antigen
MGRIKIVLALLSVMVMVVAAAAPAALAAGNHNNKQNNNQHSGNQNNKQHSGNNGSAFFVVNDDDNDFDHNGFDNDFDHNGFDQDIDETGDVRLDTSIINTGNNSNQCAAPLQFGNTGNSQNAQGFTQLDSFADDIELEGGSFEFLPEQAVECGQGVFQSAAASG